MVVCIWTMEVDKGLTLCTWCIFPDPLGSRFINSQTRRIPSCHSPGMLHGSFQVFHFRLVKNSVLRWTCRLSNCAADLRSNDLAMLQQTTNQNIGCFRFASNQTRNLLLSLNSPCDQLYQLPMEQRHKHSSTLVFVHIPPMASCLPGAFRYLWIAAFHHRCC